MQLEMSKKKSKYIKKVKESDLIPEDVLNRYESDLDTYLDNEVEKLKKENTSLKNDIGFNLT